MLVEMIFVWRETKDTEETKGHTREHARAKRMRMQNENLQQ